jgi:hypothetical protein
MVKKIFGEAWRKNKTRGCNVVGYTLLQVVA